MINVPSLQKPGGSMDIVDIKKTNTCKGTNLDLGALPKSNSILDRETPERQLKTPDPYSQKFLAFGARKQTPQMGGSKKLSAGFPQHDAFNLGVKQ